jgi:membrane protein insertase Oxa1/YidC/SpoIIIJ
MAGGLIGIVALLVGIGSLVCFIIVLIKLFQNEGALKGILGIICGLYTFIWGWMNANNQGIKNIMMIWTLLLIIQLVLNFAFGVALIPGYPPQPTPVTP